MNQQISSQIPPQTLQPTTTAQLPVQQLPVTIQPTVNIEALLNLTRPITVNGQAISLTPEGILSLQTNLGKIDVLLANVKSDFFQSLNTLLTSSVKDSQKPFFELFIQSGKPAKEATLLVPMNEKGQPLNIKATEQQQAPFTHKQEVPFTKGQSITLSPLPKGVETQILTKTNTQAQPLNAAQEGKGGPLQNLAVAAQGIKEKDASLFKQVTSGAEFLAQKDGKGGDIRIGGAERAVTPPALSTTSSSKFRIDQIIQPKSDFPLNLKPDQVKAEIIGKSLSGQMVVKSEGQSYVIPNKGTLPSGTKLILTAQPFNYDALAPRPSSEQEMLRTLQELISTLHQSSPDAAQSLVSKLPSPQQNMSTTMLFLFSAIQGGKMDEWIGPSRLAHLTASARKRITDGIMQSFNERGIPARDDTGEWRSWSLPLLNEHALDAIRLYVKQDHKDKTDQPEAKDKPLHSRFVISMQLNELGKMQLDGLSKPNHLDLIVRSEKTLPEDLLADLTETAKNIYEATGLTGSIHFYQNTNEWITFREEDTFDVDI